MNLNSNPAIVSTKFLTVAVSFALVGPTSIASTSPESIDLHIHTRTRAHSFRTPFKAPSTTLVPATFQQLIDHAGSANGPTFSQRYWTDSQFAKSASAPVILHICGEGDAEQGYFLNDNAVAWAKELGARIVYLEHRYYGKSLPFADFSTEHLAYLTLDNVMEDMADFQKSLAVSNGWTGKWISVGGSYSGTLSAIYRQRHPELVVGALAASAPMISGVGDPVGDQDYVSDLTPIESDDRPWAYQACTTFGFWEADGEAADANLQNPSAWLCQQVFANAPIVDSQIYNVNYNAPFISNGKDAISHILFTYGSDDVWTKLGLSQQTNLNTEIEIRVIPGAGHHFDLNAPAKTDSAGVIAARAEFSQLAKRWLTEN